MWLHAGADAANGSDRVFSAVAALQSASKLPATEQAADPPRFAWLFGLPDSGDWVHDCLVRIGPGLPPGFSYLACAAARAAVGPDARCGGGPAGGYRSRLRSVNTSIAHRSVGGRGHELGVLHPAGLTCDDTATQLGVRTGGVRRLSDRPSHPPEGQRLWRRDNPAAFRGFATSGPLARVIVALSRCRGIAANRCRQPARGWVDRPRPRNPSPNADSMAVGTKGPRVVVAAWFTWHRSG
jgi:hypothetical protein